MTTYASIYTLDGAELTTGLQTAARCDEAYRAAVRFAADREEAVHLLDSDGEWLVYPDGTVKIHTIPAADYQFAAGE